MTKGLPASRLHTRWATGTSSVSMYARVHIYMCSQCEDSYLYRTSPVVDPPTKHHLCASDVRTWPTSSRRLVIASGTSACPEVRAAQEREERARQRATSADGTLSIGETAPRPLFRPKSLYWPLLSLLLTPVGVAHAMRGRLRCTREGTQSFTHELVRPQGGARQRARGALLRPLAHLPLRDRREAR